VTSTTRGFYNGILNLRWPAVLGLAKPEPAPPELSMMGGTAELDNTLSPRRAEMTPPGSPQGFSSEILSSSLSIDPFSRRLLM